MTSVASAIHNDPGYHFHQNNRTPLFVGLYDTPAYQDVISFGYLTPKNSYGYLWGPCMIHEQHSTIWKQLQDELRPLVSRRIQFKPRSLMNRLFMVVSLAIWSVLFIVIPQTLFPDLNSDLIFVLALVIWLFAHIFWSFRILFQNDAIDEQIQDLLTRPNSKYAQLFATIGYDTSWNKTTNMAGFNLLPIRLPNHTRQHHETKCGVSRDDNKTASDKNNHCKIKTDYVAMPP